MPRSDAWPRTILYVELDAFLTSVHQRDDPALRGRAIAVAGGTRRAVVAGASYEALVFGVQPEMPVAEALERCPDLAVVPPQQARYREASRQAQAILRRFTSPDHIETISLGEAYLDMTARTRHGTSTPEEVARRIKFAVHDELQLSATVGAATSKLVARVAGASRRPDGLVLVPPGSEADFLAPLPISAIPGLGPKTGEKLRLMGVRTVGDLAGFEANRLLQSLGSGGMMLQRMAQGRDRSPVEGNRPAKTISAETTFDADTRDSMRLNEVLQDLIQKLAERLRADGVRARTISIKIKLADARLLTRQVSRPSATDDPGLLYRAAQAAVTRLHLGEQPVKLLGVGLSGLAHPQHDPQLTLFD